jgi:hypothetical protein
VVIRSVARGGARGGSSISTTRPTRARLIAALLAFGVGLVVVRLSLDLRTGALVFVTGTAAVVVLMILAAVLVLAKPHLIGAAQAVLAVFFVSHVLVSGESTWEALGLASLGILLFGELSQWSIDSRVVGRYEPGLHQSRAVGVAALVALGLGVITLAAVALGLPTLGDPWAVVAAIAASLALLVLITEVTRGASGSSAGQTDTGG